MFTFLQGYRTYLLAGAGAVVVFLQLTGHLSASDANTLLILLGFGSVAALRAGVNAGRSK